MLGRSRLFALTMALFLALPALIASAENAPAKHTRTQMYTHPSQGPVTMVEGSTAHLRSNDQGVTVTVRTHDLVPGNAHTFWVLIFNNPEECEALPCTVNDLLNRTDIVEANVIYGGGRVVRSHTTPFQAHIPVGDLEGGWYENGFTNPRNADIHVVINDHGPIIPGLTLEMTRSYRAGCRDDSIPPAFPATAFADGTPGPNTCRLVQFGAFVQQ